MTEQKYANDGVWSISGVFHLRNNIKQSPTTLDQFSSCPLSWILLGLDCALLEDLCVALCCA